MTSNAPPDSRPNAIEIEYDEHTYKGYYTMDSELIYVTYGERSITTQLGGSKEIPQTLARVILHELVEAVHGTA